MERLERWRPQWKVSYTSGGETGAVLCAAIARRAVDALRFEMACMQILERNGILVPHIHGWMDEPVAFVMDWVETEDRAPGCSTRLWTRRRRWIPNAGRPRSAT